MWTHLIPIDSSWSFLQFIFCIKDDWTNILLAKSWKLVTNGQTGSCPATLRRFWNRVLRQIQLDWKDFKWRIQRAIERRQVQWNSFKNERVISNERGSPWTKSTSLAVSTFVFRLADKMTGGRWEKSLSISGYLGGTRIMKMRCKRCTAERVGNRSNQRHTLDLLRKFSISFQLKFSRNWRVTGAVFFIWTRLKWPYRVAYLVHAEPLLAGVPHFEIVEKSTGKTSEHLGTLFNYCDQW